MRLNCTENEKTHEEMDEKEVIDLCSESQTTTSEHCKGEESKKWENHDTEESKIITTLESEDRPEKNFQVQETEEDEVEMMCWENSEGSLAEEHNKETDDQDGRADNEMEKPKHEEEHASSILLIGNQLKLSIKEFSWGTEDNVSMLNTHETAQQKLVYITNLAEDLQNHSIELNEEEGPKDKKPAAKNRPLEGPVKVYIEVHKIARQHHTHHG